MLLFKINDPTKMSEKKFTTGPIFKLTFTKLCTITLISLEQCDRLH